MSQNKDVEFANDFILERIKFFEKDIRICLRKYRSKHFDEGTHAYFPALMICCANLDFMGCLYAGKYENSGKPEVIEFVKEFMDTTTYSEDAIDVLWEGFRNKIAHLAHPEYVFDTSTRRKVFPDTKNQRRITWVVDEKKIINHKDRIYQHMQIRKEEGEINDKILKPYPVPYTHIISISLPVFKSDIQNAMKAYLIKMKNDPARQSNFKIIMARIFPQRQALSGDLLPKLSGGQDKG